jgi:monoamine oxidase
MEWSCYSRLVGGQSVQSRSYSYWRVGQYTRFAGVEREPQEGVHFCGEHTSIEAQGYLEGAVETGERAANEIISALR